MNNWWVYVLKLEKGKYYVGITSQTPEARFKQHSKGVYGASWTKKYRPIEIFDTKYLGEMNDEKANLFEARTTRKYIKKYGLDNVRGGDLTSTEDYFSRFGGYVTRNDWVVITVTIFLMVTIAALLLDKYGII